MPLLVRESTKARRFTLRVYPDAGGKIVLTIPLLHSKKQVFKFIEQSKPWLAKQITNVYPSIPYQHGMILPIFGKAYELRHRASQSFHSWWGNDHLIIHAPEDKFGYYVQKSLQQVAKTFLQDRTSVYANRLEKTVRRITLRDTRSRWGSCSPDGNISYSWRLIFAPYLVADYVCAHEVAHLIELNHSSKYWQVVERLCPEYKKFRLWLRQNGKSLMQYGIEN